MDYSKMHFGSLTVSKTPEYPASHERTDPAPAPSKAERLAEALDNWDGVLMLPLGWRQQTADELRRLAGIEAAKAPSHSLPPPPAVFQGEQGPADIISQRYQELQRRIADLMAAHSLSYIDLLSQALDRFESVQSLRGTGWTEEG